MKTINNPSKKEALLDAAQNLMLEKGFVATTLEEICCASETTKGSFFHYFKSKEELGKELVERFARGVSDFMEAALLAVGDDPLDRVYAMVDAHIKVSEKAEFKGCLLGTFSQELSVTHPEIMALCTKRFEDVANIFNENLSQAKIKYAPKTSFDVDSLAEYFIAISQGSMIMMKAQQDRSIIKKNLMHFKQYLKYIFGK
jgi:TetR/AcrR family transcriptional regulator, transcriptional repressor for nem operon